MHISFTAKVCDKILFVNAISSKIEYCKTLYFCAPLNITTENLATLKSKREIFRQEELTVCWKLKQYFASIVLLTVLHKMRHIRFTWLYKLALCQSCQMLNDESQASQRGSATLRWARWRAVASTVRRLEAFCHLCSVLCHDWANILMNEFGLQPGLGTCCYSERFWLQVACTPSRYQHVNNATVSVFRKQCMLLEPQNHRPCHQSAARMFCIVFPYMGWSYSL